MDGVAAPVTLLVAVGVDGEVEVVQFRVIDVAVNVNLVEDLGVALVFAEPSDLKRRRTCKVKVQVTLRQR